MSKLNRVKPNKIKGEAQAKILTDMFEEMGVKVIDVTPKKKNVVEYLDTHHPCKKCKGFVPDDAIVCIHCKEHDP